ncbi:hypothetical protein JCM10213_002166 [Rhodosporidiobolus nylandii]
MPPSPPPLTASNAVEAPADRKAAQKPHDNYQQQRNDTSITRAGSFEADDNSERRAGPTSEDTAAGDEPDVEDVDEDGSGELGSWERGGQQPGEGERAMLPFAGGEGGRTKRRGSSPPSSEGNRANSSGGEDSDVAGASVTQEGGRAVTPRRRRKRRRLSGSFSPAAAGPPAPGLPRPRRIGALGISVHSDSDGDLPLSGLDDDNPPPNDEPSSDETRATDLGITASQLRQGNSSEDALLKSARQERKMRREGDETFRDVVDDLVIENLELKSRLKRYEAQNVPPELKRESLFEVRFGPGLPAEQRLELEAYLASYVQNFVQKASSRPTPAEPPTAARPPPIRRRSVDRDASIRRAARPPSLAGPSNSGLEPPSLSGTGAGMRFPPPTPRTAFPTLAMPTPRIDSPTGQATAHEVVAAIEDLFYHSLLHISPPADIHSAPHPPPPSDAPPSNETYFSHLLSHTSLSQGGFVYLNLACTMAGIHRFNTTLAFVQQAIRQFSTKLEVSADGGMVRWAGSTSPSELRRELGVADAANEPRTLGGPATTRASSGEGSLVEGRAGSGEKAAATETDSKASSSGDPSSGSRSLGRSLAAPSTAATSQPSLGPAQTSCGGEQKPPARLPRPLPAVLQPMDRLNESREEVAPAEQLGGVSRASTKERLRPRFASPPTISAVRLADCLRTVSPPSSSGSSTPDDEHQPSASVVLDAEEGGRSGALVFYANSYFCSDLTKDASAVPGALAVVDAIAKEVALGVASQDSSSSSPGSSSRTPSSIELSPPVSGESLNIEAGATPPSTSGEESGTGSLERLRTSGMTLVSPADLFTLVVRTSHADKRPASPPVQIDEVSEAAKALPTPPLSAPQIVSLRTIHHDAKRTTRNPFEIGFLSTTSGETSSIELSDEERQREEDLLRPHQLLTTSNLLKHSGNPLPPPPPPPPLYPARMPPGHFTNTPSPPHEDYLLSLAAPSHVWAPPEPGLHSGVGSSVAPSPTGRSAGLPNGASTTGLTISTGDERPIALDEMVGMTREQVGRQQR